MTAFAASPVCAEVMPASCPKRAAVISGAKYFDFGCNFEVFTNPDYLELETLGPLVELGAGKAVEHVEHWWLFADVPSGENEAWIDTAVVPLIQKTGREQ
jgi:hypothetical protein